MIPLEYREIFCNDFKLPIKIYDSPLFEYYLDLFEDDLKISEKVAIFNETLKHFKTPQAFTDEWHKIKNSIINDVESVPAFQSFVEQSSQKGYQSPYKVERGNVFNHKYKGLRMLSIDLVSANFNSLRYFDPSIVFGCTNFAEMVARYSDIPYYSFVKIFRQVVFEKLHSNKQQTMQRQMMDKVLNSLFEEFTHLELRMPSNDEIVIPLNESQKGWEEKIKQIVGNHELSEILKIETYLMEHICEDHFYQRFDDGRIKLRNVPSPFYSRYLKMAKGIALTEEDSYFMFEGRKAKFID